MKTILLAGCGGGYDVFGAIPLYLKYKKEHIYISSLSFTHRLVLDECSCVKKLQENLYLVDASEDKVSQKFDYFPEYYLSYELKKEIYVILVNSTIKQIEQAYLFISNKFDEIYMIDGGCDALLSGTETDLATPVEDMMNLKAIEQIPCHKKYVCAVGLNCDCGHGVIEKELVERLKYMRENNIILSERNWSLNDSDIQTYVNICKKSNLTNTIVHSLIIARLHGESDYHTPKFLRHRITNDKVYLSDLTTTFVVCDYNSLIQTIIYFGGLKNDFTRDIADDYIEGYVK